MGKGQRERYYRRHDLQREPIAVAAPPCVQLVNQTQAGVTPVAAAAAATSPSASVAVHSPSLNYYSEEDEDGFIISLLHAAQRIPVDASFEKEEVPIIKQICLPYIGRLKSIQNLEGFLQEHRLVGPVKIFGDSTIQVGTAQGRLLFQAVVDAILDCHSKNKSWDGTFDSKQIRIIKPWHSKEFVMILKVPVGFKSKASLLQATAKDLRTAADILIPRYKVGKNMPPYFLELKEDLEGAATELRANERSFMEYLSYHPAIMPSTGRNTFMTKLNSIPKHCNVLRPIMLLKPYPRDWKTIVESEIVGNENDKAAIKILNDVYYYNSQPGKEYENTVRGLSRFLRNLLEHGKEHDARVRNSYELELYLAQMFSNFLPRMVRTLLDSAKMEVYGEDWSTYKMSKSSKWEPTWSR